MLYITMEAPAEKGGRGWHLNLPACSFQHWLKLHSWGGLESAVTLLIVHNAKPYSASKWCPVCYLLLWFICFVLQLKEI